MPCFEPENVDAQRGNGVFDASILALQLLNQLGCGRQDDFVLDLVYNQAELESDYKRELKNHFGIDFHRVYTTATWNAVKDGSPLFLWDIDPKRLEDRPIALGKHCFGCTAGCGSSCSGALT